jgi:hypothetical protein
MRKAIVTVGGKLAEGLGETPGEALGQAIARLLPQVGVSLTELNQRVAQARRAGAPNASVRPVDGRPVAPSVPVLSPEAVRAFEAAAGAMLREAARAAAALAAAIAKAGLSATLSAAAEAERRRRRCSVELTWMETQAWNLEHPSGPRLEPGQNWVSTRTAEELMRWAMARPLAETGGAAAARPTLTGSAMGDRWTGWVPAVAAEAWNREHPTGPVLVSGLVSMPVDLADLYFDWLSDQSAEWSGAAERVAGLRPSRSGRAPAGGESGAVPGMSWSGWVSGSASVGGARGRTSGKEPELETAEEESGTGSGRYRVDPDPGSPLRPE